MGAINPIPYTTPDGVERFLRWTMGAQRRVTAEFNMPDLTVILDKFGSGAVPRVLYQCLFDENGKPPEGLSMDVFIESFPGDIRPGYNAVAMDGLSALMSAVTQGTVPKNEWEARIAEESQRLQIGSNSGASAVIASDSQTPNSGTSTQPNSSLSQTDISESRDSQIAEQDS